MRSLNINLKKIGEIDLHVSEYIKNVCYCNYKKGKCI